MSALAVLPPGIASRIIVSADGCWIWTTSLNPDGYGRVWFDGKTRSPHRVVYELLVGPIPAGLELDHLCRNRPCVNPAHLEPVTHGENMRRGLHGYALRTLCKSGRHDITDPANIHLDPATGRRRCRPCAREAWRRAQRRYEGR